MLIARIRLKKTSKLLDVSMRVSGIGAVGVVCMSRIDALTMSTRGCAASTGGVRVATECCCCRPSVVVVGSFEKESGDAVLVVASASAAEDDTTRVARRSVCTSARHDSEPR